MSDLVEFEIRAKLLALQSELEQLPQIDCPLEHYFAPGQYGRVITMPKGSCVVGKIHLHAHLNVLIKGRCTVLTPTGERELKAGDVFVSEPGTKRAVYNHTETRWMTVHNNASGTTDLTQLEGEVIAPSFQHYERHAMSYAPKHLIPTTMVQP